MVIKIPKIEDIPVEEQTPLVLMLLEYLNLLAEENQALRDEIARLKGQKPKPKIKSLPASNPDAKTNLKHKASGLALPSVIKQKI